jgi:hypothetical protein
MPDQPRVQSFTVNDDQGRPVRFTIGTDIIDYAESARAFGREDLAATDVQGRFQRRLFAVPDRKSAVVSPMVFSVGSQNGLSLVRRQDGSDSTAWKLIDLGRAFQTAVGPNPQIRALGVGWTDDDKITIAVAVDGGAAGAPSRVFVAWDLSSRDTDFETIQWVDCGVRESVRVEGIRVLDDGNGVWTVVLGSDRGRDGTLYLLRSNRKPQTFATALVFTPAVTFQEIYDFQAGVDPFVGPGIAVVGRSGSTDVLAFRPFPKYDKEGKIKNTPPTVPLPCPAGARVLETGVTRNEGSDLYIAGEGVQLIVADEFDNLDEAAVTQVAAPKTASGVQNFVVSDAADGSAAVWSVLRNGDLTVVKRKAGQKSWSNPLRIRAGVRDIAPVHGDRHTTTSVLIVYSDGKASFLWQDAAATVWQETPLLVRHPQQVSKATCYGTTLRVLAATSSPRQGVKVRVSASVLANVVVNRNAVFLGPDLTFETETDANGAVAVFDRVRSLTPAILRFSIAGIPQSIDVNPAGGIHQRFHQISAEELRSAAVKAPDGRSTPLLGESFRTGGQKNQLDAVASSLNQAAGLSKSADGVVGGVRTVTATAAYSSALRLETLPANYRWGIEADSKGVRAASSSVMDSLTSAARSVGDFFVNLGESIADFFEGIWNRIKEGWTFVVEKVNDGVNFICKLGDKVNRWILKTLEQIGSFFTWLWDQIQTALEKLWEWLKFIFDWKDMLRVRDAMVSITGQALDHFERSIDGLKTTVDGGFADLSRIIRGWANEPAPSSSGGAGSALVGGAMTALNVASSVIDKIMGNSVVAWVMSKLQSIIDYIVKIEMPDLSAAVKSAIEGLRKLMAGTIGAFADIAVKLGAAIEKIFGASFDIDNLNPDVLKRVFASAGANILDSLVNLVRNLVVGSMDLVKSLVGVCRAVLSAKMSFPLVEQLVKTLTLGLVSVDTSFRMIDGLMLLVAIPVTIACKIITGGSPLRSGENIVLPFGRVSVSGAEEDVLRMLTIFGPLGVGLVKIIVSWVDLGDALLNAPKWHTVSPVSAAFGVVGFAGEIALMDFGADTAPKVLESIMVHCAGVMAIISVIGAFKRNDSDAERQSWSEFLGFEGAALSVIRIALRGGIVGLADQKGMSPAEKLKRSAMFFEDFAQLITGIARMDATFRMKFLKGGMLSRAVGMGLNSGHAYMVLK